jgi:hypothetical protein
VLQVHLSDGQTLKFDLQDERQARDWLARVQSNEFQSSVRGVTLHSNGVQYSIPRPMGFRRVWIFAEALQPDVARRFKGGERAIVQLDNVRVVAMAHNEQRALRVSLSRVGAQCYNPLMAPGASANDDE